MKLDGLIRYDKSTLALDAPTVLGKARRFQRRAHPSRDRPNKEESYQGQPAWIEIASGSGFADALRMCKESRSVPSEPLQDAPSSVIQVQHVSV